MALLAFAILRPVFFGGGRGPADPLDRKLLRAVSRGDAAKVQSLLDQGANVNTSDEDLRTVLHRAANLGRLEVARVLLANGADVNAEEQFGATPLDGVGSWMEDNEPVWDVNAHMEVLLRTHGGERRTNLRPGEEERWQQLAGAQDETP